MSKCCSPGGRRSPGDGLTEADGLAKEESEGRGARKDQQLRMHQSKSKDIAKGRFSLQRWSRKGY